MSYLNKIVLNTILILLLFAVNNSTLAEWINISTDKNGSSIYADPTTIQKSGDRTKMWVLFAEIPLGESNCPSSEP